MNRFWLSIKLWVIFFMTSNLIVVARDIEEIKKDFYSSLRKISKISRIRGYAHPKTCLIPYTPFCQNHFCYRFIVNALIRAGVYTFTTSDFLPSSLFNFHRDDITLLNKKGRDYIPILQSKVDYIIPIFSTSFHQDHEFYFASTGNLKKVLPFFTSYKASLFAPLWMERKQCYFCYDQEFFSEKQAIFSLLHFLNENIYNQDDLITLVFSRFFKKYPVYGALKTYKSYSYLNFFSQDKALIRRCLSEELWYGGDGEMKKSLLKLLRFPTDQEREYIKNLLDSFK